MRNITTIDDLRDFLRSAPKWEEGMDFKEWRAATTADIGAVPVTTESFPLLIEWLAAFGPDEEIAHRMADEWLLQVIGDDAVTAAFESLDKWYA